MRPSAAVAKAYDAIIVGGGHNGLVAAAYLAKAGKRVCLLERRHVLGGAAITEEIVPGFKFSRASYVYSLFRPQIVNDLGLFSRGLTLLPRVPSSFTPSPEAGGPSLLLGGGAAADAAEIAKLSARDAQRYPEYNALLDRYCDALRPLLDRAPHDPGNLWHDGRGKLADWLDNLRDGAFMAERLASLGRDLPGFIEIMTAPASKLLERWFEGPMLQATLGTDAIIGAMLSPSTPGSAYVLLHHVMCGTWCNVRGGMGALSQAVASAARDAGAELRTDAAVKRIVVEPFTGDTNLTRSTAGRVAGVELADGTLLRSPVVLSNAAPQVTFGRLLEGSGAQLPPQFSDAVRTLNSASGSVKINLALDRLPVFKSRPSPPGQERVPQPWHHGTIHFEQHPQQIEAAYRDAAAGRVSSRPVIEMTIPSALDDSLAPPGKHVALLFCQYAPYGSDARQFARHVYDVIEEHAPGFKDSIIGEDILMPQDLERVFGLPGGNIFHSSLSLDQLFWLRPAAGWARYRTPVSGLYLGGAGAHPGGGVMGAPGRNAALTVLRDLQQVRI